MLGCTTFRLIESEYFQSKDFPYEYLYEKLICRLKPCVTSRRNILKCMSQSLRGVLEENCLKNSMKFSVKLTFRYPL